MVRPSPHLSRAQAQLPTPLLQEWSWQENAACRTHSVEEFFVADRLPGDPRAPRGTADAKAICWDCPVRRACLQHALSVPERFGVWGGLSASERDRLREAPGA